MRALVLDHSLAIIMANGNCLRLRASFLASSNFNPRRLANALQLQTQELTAFTACLCRHVWVWVKNGSLSMAGCNSSILFLLLHSVWISSPTAQLMERAWSYGLAPRVRFSNGNFILV